MQQYKKQFTDPGHTGTVCNLQSCLRLDDLDEVGDGTHYLSFGMLGMFSFRELTVEETVRHWLTFLEDLGIKPDYVTVHPDRKEWSHFYPEWLEVREDLECTWTDGSLTGYCTEFFVGDLEIGNIVNPNGDCIDVGFGLERLCMVLGEVPPSTGDVLRSTVQQLIADGYKPGNKRQDYALRRLLRLMVVKGFDLDHPYMQKELDRQERSRLKYERLVQQERHRDKLPDWWWSTHGIDVSSM